MSREFPTIIGLDPSVTSFGYGRVDVDGNVDGSGAIVPKKLSGAQRLVYIREGIREQLDGVWLAVLEGYAFSRVNLSHLGEVVGVIKVLLLEEGIVTAMLSPSGLKKFVTGRGNAKKDEMRLEAFKRFDFEAKSQDEVEAVLLAQAGWHWDQMRSRGLAPTEDWTSVPVSHLAGLEKMEVSP